MGNVPVKAYNPSRKKKSSKSSSKKRLRHSSQQSLSSIPSRVSTETSSAIDGSTNDDDYGHSVEGKRQVRYEKFRQNQPIPEDAPPAIQLVRKYLYYKDAQNIEGMERLTTAKRCTFTFVDAEAEMTAKEFHQSMKEVFASFPNLHFFWKFMRITGVDAATQSTIVEVGDYFGIGKHEGRPYAFGPYEAIPATGKTVRDEKILFTFFVKDGKIIKAIVDAFGDIVGPPGFYTKIGGIIPHLYWYEPSSS